MTHNELLSGDKVKLLAVSYAGGMYNFTFENFNPEFGGVSTFSFENDNEKMLDVYLMDVNTLIDFIENDHELCYETEDGWIVSLYKYGRYED